MLISPPAVNAGSLERTAPLARLNQGDPGQQQSRSPQRRRALDGWRIGAISTSALLHILMVGWLALPDTREPDGSRPAVLRFEDESHERLLVFVELQAPEDDLPPPLPPPPIAAHLQLSARSPARIPEPLPERGTQAALPTPPAVPAVDTSPSGADNAPQAVADVAPQATSSAAAADAGVAPTLRAASTEESRKARDDYVRALMAALLRHRSYPAAARKARDHGVVHVRFSVDREGHVLRSAIARSNGSPILDAAALGVLERASPLPPIPPSMDQDTLTITVPIEYTLITR